MKIDTYEIQVNGRTEIVMQGELRDDNAHIGPGGVFTVLNNGKFVQKGDQVFLIALPDAPKTSQPNPKARSKK